MKGFALETKKFEDNTKFTIQLLRAVMDRAAVGNTMGAKEPHSSATIDDALAADRAVSDLWATRLRSVKISKHMQNMHVSSKSLDRK